MGFPARIGLLSVLLVTSLGACATVDKTRETAGTVDDAVALMQALDERGAASRVGQGVDDLGTAGAGYEATVIVRQGILNADGTTGPTAREWTYTLQVDGDGDLRAALADGETATYLVPGDESTPASVYLATADGYVCALEDPAAAGLSARLGGLIAAHGALAAAPQTLAVIARPVEVTIADRDATQHTFVSRIPDALRIVEEYGGDDALEQAIAVAEEVAFGGEVVFDDATGALLRLDSTTVRHDEGLWAGFHFEVTAWDGIADIPRPAAEEIAAPCQ